MKRISTALAAAALAALAACGGTATNNAAVVNDAESDTYNVAPDDLTAGNEVNESGNASDANAAADANASGGNAQ